MASPSQSLSNAPIANENLALTAPPLLSTSLQTTIKSSKPAKSDSPNLTKDEETVVVVNKFLTEFPEYTKLDKSNKDDGKNEEEEDTDNTGTNNEDGNITKKEKTKVDNYRDNLTKLKEYLLKFIKNKNETTKESLLTPKLIINEIHTSLNEMLKASIAITANYDGSIYNKHINAIDNLHTLLVQYETAVDSVKANRDKKNTETEQKTKISEAETTIKNIENQLKEIDDDKTSSDNDAFEKGLTAARTAVTEAEEKNKTNDTTDALADAKTALKALEDQKDAKQKTASDAEKTKLATELGEATKKLTVLKTLANNPPSLSLT